MRKMSRCTCLRERSGSEYTCLRRFAQIAASGEMRGGGRASGRSCSPDTWPRLRRLAEKHGQKIRVEKTEKSGPRITRGGAARATSDSGGGFAQLPGAVQWHSFAYRLFLDLGILDTMASTIVKASDDGGAGTKGADGRIRDPLEP